MNTTEMMLAGLESASEIDLNAEDQVSEDIHNLMFTNKSGLPK